MYKRERDRERQSCHKQEEKGRKEGRKEEQVAPLTLSRCSTPTSSDSSAPILHGMCLNTLWISRPCPCTSSTLSYL